MIQEKYLIFNPLEGKYEKVDNITEVIERLSSISIEFLKAHSMNSFYRKAFIDEHGYEYLNADGDNGTELPKEYLESLVTSIQKDLSDEIIPIETI